MAKRWCRKARGTAHLPRQPSRESLSKAYGPRPRLRSFGSDTLGNVTYQVSQIPEVHKNVHNNELRGLADDRSGRGCSSESPRLGKESIQAPPSTLLLVVRKSAMYGEKGRRAQCQGER